MAGTLWGHKAAIAAYLMILLGVSGYALVVLWPSTSSSGGATGSATSVTIFGWSFVISEEQRLLLLVIVAGAIGSMVFGLYAEFLHIARADFESRWILWYLARPFIGAFFALVFYLVLRAGLVGAQTPTADVNAFGFAAISALVGMFSEEALAKLKSIAENLLTKAAPYAENYYTGEKVPASGKYLFVKHPPGTTCGDDHSHLIVSLNEGDPFPTPDCKQTAIWMRL